MTRDAGPELDRALLELAEQARRDELTGLLNHWAFSQDLEAEVARADRYGHGLTLLSLALDGLEPATGALGSAEADLVLRSVARGLEATVRESDVVGRIGGAEFSVLLLESGPDAAGCVLRRLAAETSALGDDLELPGGLRFREGVAQYASDAEDAAGLFRLADSRLHDATRANGG